MFNEEVIIPIVMFGSIYFIAKLVLEHRTRNKLIDKGMVDEKIKFLFSDYGKTKTLNNVKWGMVLLGIGVALLIKQIAPFYVADETVFGFMFIFAGLGFLLFYFLADQRLKDKSNQNDI